MKETTIIRNERICKRFNELLTEGTRCGEALGMLAKEFYLSARSVQDIVYAKAGKGK